MSRAVVVRVLPEPQRTHLLHRAVRRTLLRDEILHLAGDPPRRIHLVTTGLLKLSARDAGGRETIIGLASPGDVVGEVAALDDGGQPTDAIATCQSEVLGIDATAFMDAVSGHAPAARELAIMLAARNRWMCETALERTSADVPARLARRLLDLARLLGKPDGSAIELEMPLAQEDLGRLAGMCRESACKTLRAFKKHGLVEYRGRKVRILKPAVLENIKCAGRAEVPFR